MIDNLGDVETVASGLSELLLDFGHIITAGKCPPRTLVARAWAITGGRGIDLWYRFPWLFDHYAGWAVLAGGFWALFLLLTVGLTAARIKHSVTAVDRDRDLPSKMR
jgi:hypothetical protein